MTKSKQRRLGVIVTLMMLIISVTLFFPDTNTLAALATPTMTPATTAIIPTCVVGPDPDCLKKPTLVAGSNGLWAYYILNGVYFEYPSTWRIQVHNTQQNHLFTVFASGSPEVDHILALHLYVYLDLLQVIKENDLLESPETILQRPTTIWKHPVTLTDFQGVEFFWIHATGHLEVFLYNEPEQIVVDIEAIFNNNDPAQLAFDPRTVEKILPNIQLLIESIRIWKRTIMDEHQIGISITNNTGHKNPP